MNRRRFLALLGSTATIPLMPPVDIGVDFEPVVIGNTTIKVRRALTLAEVVARQEAAHAERRAAIRAVEDRWLAEIEAFYGAYAPDPACAREIAEAVVFSPRMFTEEAA